MNRYDSLDMSKEEFSDVSQAFFIFHGGRNRFLFKVSKNGEPSKGEHILMDRCETPFKVLAIGDCKTDDSVVYLFTEVMMNEV